MRESQIPILVLFWIFRASAQTIPADWKVIKDSRQTCQIAVPPEWSQLADSSGAAILHTATTAIAVVTSQPGQIFKPLPESLQKVLGIGKEKMFENTVKRLFYQDKTSRNSSEPNSYSVSVPSKAGTCSCHITFLPMVPDETARKIALSLGPVTEADRQAGRAEFEEDTPPPRPRVGERLSATATRWPSSSAASIRVSPGTGRCEPSCTGSFRLHRPKHSSRESQATRSCLDAASPLK
jgi:hypothetical protein